MAVSLSCLDTPDPSASFMFSVGILFSFKICKAAFSAPFHVGGCPFLRATRRYSVSAMLFSDGQSMAFICVFIGSECRVATVFWGPMGAGLGVYIVGIPAFFSCLVKVFPTFSAGVSV